MNNFIEYFQKCVNIILRFFQNQYRKEVYMADKIFIGSRIKRIAKGSISKWNVIEPSFDKVCRVAKILDVEIKQLVL